MAQTAGSTGIFLDQATPWAGRIIGAMAWLNENLRLDRAAVKVLIDALLPEAEAEHDRVNIAWLHFYLGWFFIDADDFEHGVAVMDNAKDSFEQSGNNEGMSRCLNAFGFSYSMLGIYDLALDFYRDAAGHADKANRTDLGGTAMANIAECLYELEEPEEALQAIERCRQDYTIAPHNVTHEHHTAGLVYRALGRTGESEQELLEAIKTAGDALHSALDSRRVLAELYIDCGRLEEAEEQVGIGLADSLRTGERLIGARYRLAKARILVVRRRAMEAITEIDAAKVAARELGVRKIEADVEKAAYEAWQLCGESGKALEAYVRYSTIKDAIKGEQTSRRIMGLHEDRVKREARHFETLYRQISSIGEIGRRITANLDLEVTLESIYGAINELMDAPTLFIALVDEGQNTLEYRLNMLRGVRNEPFSVPLTADSFGCWCVNNRSDILIGDLETEYSRYVRSYRENTFGGNMENSIVFVPLLVGNKVAGILSVQSHIRNAYDRKSVEIVKAVGAYIGIAIENFKLFSQIQKLATFDGLTGLLNRRCLSEAIDEEYVKVRRYKRNTAIIMADIDYFKKVNDTHGHDVGDQVLRGIARVFREKARNCDSVGRYGGEEFLLVLPETGIEGAGILAERLRAAVEAMETTLPDGTSLMATASFGVAAVSAEDQSYEVALKRADDALYRSKKAGRNRVTLETEM